MDRRELQKLGLGSLSLLYTSIIGIFLYIHNSTIYGNIMVFPILLTVFAIFICSYWGLRLTYNWAAKEKNDNLQTIIRLLVLLIIPLLNFWFAVYMLS